MTEPLVMLRQAQHDNWVSRTQSVYLRFDGPKFVGLSVREPGAKTNKGEKFVYW